MIRSSDGYDPFSEFNYRKEEIEKMNDANNGSSDWERGVDPFENSYDKGETSEDLIVKIKDSLRKETKMREEELKEKINNFLWEILPGFTTIDLAEEISVEIYQTIMRKIYND